MAEEDKDRGPGQPSKYDPKFCEQVIEHFKQGKSFMSFGAKAKAGRATLYRWREEHPEFDEAVELGEQHALEFWENMMVAHATGTLDQVIKGGAKSANAEMVRFAVKNRFNKEYNERHIVENKGTLKVGGTVDIAGINDPAKLRELAEQYASEAAKVAGKIKDYGEPNPLEGGDPIGEN